MKVAIPTENGMLCPHFGHCQVFTIVEIDATTSATASIQTVTPPPHELGVIPAWLHQIGCTHIIAGGIGHRAVALLEQNGVHVISGIPPMPPEQAVHAWLADELKAGSNPCLDSSFHRHSHGEGGCGSGHHHE